MTQQHENPAANHWLHEGPVEVDGLHIDFFQGTVERDGRTVELTAKELRLLHYLIVHRGRVVSREELLDNVWRYRSNVTRTVDMHIAILRRKLGITALTSPRLLTSRGRGYVFL